MDSNGPVGVIFIDDGTEIREMREVAYEAEKILQDLIAKHPAVLAGEQVDTTDPRRWVLVAQEAGLPGALGGPDRWAIDHVLLDQDAIPTFVEVKRSSNTQIRREIVGQMLDYAANAEKYWPEGRLRALHEKRFPDVETAEADLAERLGRDDPAGFWADVDSNLADGRLRLIFVADAIPQELRRIVVFLDEHMEPQVRVCAIEVRRYAMGAARDTTALVPRVVAASARADSAQAAKAATARPRRQWDRASFLAELSTRVGADELRVAETLMKWAGERDLRLWFGKGAYTGTVFPVKDDAAGQEHFTFSIWTDGIVNVEFRRLQQSPAFEDVASRMELLDRLNEMPGVDVPPERIEQWGRVPLAALVSNTETFVKHFDWVVARLP